MKKIKLPSPKIELYPKDKELSFEEKLTRVERFNKISFQSDLSLLDGVASQKNLNEFQIKLNKPSNIKEISNKKENGEYKGKDIFKRIVYNNHIKFL